MRLRHALPAGLVDAGCNSLATLVMGVYAAWVLAGPDLGTYALFFSAYVLAVVVPMQFVLVPAEIASLRVAGRDRLAVLRQAGRIGAPVALVAALTAALAACVAATAPVGLLVALALTTAASGVTAPLQDHLRRVLHLGGLSWHAALVSLLLFVAMGATLVVFEAAGLAPGWRPFGALAIANVLSGAVGLVLIRRHLRPGPLPRLRVARLARSGRWLLLVEVATAGAMFVASALVNRLAGPEALGDAEAARIVAQPVFVLAQGLIAVLGPRLMEAGADRDEAHARSVSRPFVALLALAGVAYGAVTLVPWWGNPIGVLVPQAYDNPRLVGVTVLATTLFGLTFTPRGELVGAGWERRIFRAALVAALGQCVVALTAAVDPVGPFARPLSLGLFSVVLLAVYRRDRRELYATAPGPRRQGPEAEAAVG
jgi:O-antigen/teichoic acid export membrane protein